MAAFAEEVYKEAIKKVFRFGSKGFGRLSGDIDNCLEVLEKATDKMHGNKSRRRRAIEAQKKRARK